LTTFIEGSGEKYDPQLTKVHLALDNLVPSRRGTVVGGPAEPAPGSSKKK